MAQAGPLRFRPNSWGGRFFHSGDKMWHQAPQQAQTQCPSLGCRVMMMPWRSNRGKEVDDG